MLLKGLIFDMDGTLLDTETISVEGWILAGKKYSVPIDKDFVLSIMGVPRAEIKKKYYSIYGTDVEFEKIHEERVFHINSYRQKHGIPLKPGVHEILAFAKENNIPCAVATSTSTESAISHLKTTGLYPSFKAVICGDAVDKGKPEPDIFITAAKAMGLFPKECAVIEDSKNGIIGAHASGAVSVLVPDVVLPDKEMINSADFIAENLLDVIEIFKQEGFYN